MGFTVLVVGSLRNDVPATSATSPAQDDGAASEQSDDGDPAAMPARLPAFQSACRDLGKAMAERGMSFIVGTDDAIDADHWVVEGAASSGKRPRVWVVRPADGARSLYEAQRDKVDLVIKRLGGPWAAVQVSQIQLADAVIVIGGKHATKTVGYAAPALGKPMLALPWFGGAGLEIWNAFRDTYARLEVATNPILGWTETGAPTKSDIDDAVESLRRIRSQHLFRVARMPAWVAAWSAFLMSLLLVVAWVIVFGYPKDAENWLHVPATGPGRYFAVLGIAAFLGGFLRNSLRVVFDPGDLVNARRLLAELVCGLLLAFGLALMFLVGAITIDGDPRTTLQSDGATGAVTPGSFERVAVVMTLLGLAGGLMIEQAADALRKWLSARLEETAGHK